MQNTSLLSARAPARPRQIAAGVDLPAVSAWTLAFALVAYLALSNGGYDTIVRSQVGVAVWWIVLLGALAGLGPARLDRRAWVAIGLLTGFAAWTGLAIGWSESAERSTIELGRVATHLGVLVLAIALQGRAAARHTVNGLACAIGLVTLLAVLSRLHPQWFPTNDHLAFFGPNGATKLSYPLNYWNALAAIAAMGVPLLLGIAIAARTLAGQALAAAMLPLSALCVYLTVSRGGALALVVGLAVFLVLAPRRLPAIATLGVAALGSGILLWAASQRDALETGVPTAAALSEGTSLLWLTVIVCAAVALLQVALALMARHVPPPALLAPDRRATTLRAAACVAFACVVAAAAGVPAAAADRWQEFKTPTLINAASQDNVFDRLSGGEGNMRYQIWQSAGDAAAANPLKGIGPGTFEFWWARHGSTPVFFRDAHSLYLETLAESGLVGLALLGGLLAFVLGTAVVRSLRSTPGVRIWIAAAAGGLAAFLTAAALDWVWEMGAIACAAMVLAAVIVAGREQAAVDVDAPAPARGRAPRLAVGLLAVLAIAAVAVPLTGAIATRDSRAAAADGRLGAALGDSATAQRVQPYAATPRLQRALVLEQAGALARAAVAARAATVQEPTNWRTWFTLARIDARRGEAAAAVQSLRHARRLNPRSPLMAVR